MDFQIKALIIAFFITVILAFIIIPILKKLKVGQIERDDGPESHLIKQGTPTMGGIIMIIAVTVITAGIFLYYINKESDMAKNMLALLLTAIGFGLIGFIDDFKKLVLKNTKGLKPAYKMFGLLLISVAYVMYLVYISKNGTDILIPILNISWSLPLVIYIPLSIFILLGTSNAINLTDGIDGLSTSITTIIITCLTVIGIIFDIKEVAVFGSIVVGACLGFLMFNLHPAKVFMGDTGSLLLGGVIASLALYLKVPLILIIIALIPILETFSVIIQVLYFKKTGKRIFKMAPLHHHFELSGWNENKIVSVFSLITLILCIIGLNVI
ncbi:MAG: phospho-N-acetylmuramoyl-pentapeptide-transferase [Clostridia bacterium]|nr:phospho-N-acetylmuramoyl-pentapeptide-transferase [Clostridia bacterium]